MPSGTLNRMPRRRYGARAYSKPKSVKSIAVSASKRVSGLRRAINSMIERKHLDTNLTSGFGSGGISTTGALLELSQIAQGDTETQRTGIQVTPQSLKLDLQLNIADTFNKFRVLIFKWYDTTTPTLNDILNPAGYGTFIQAPYNWVNGRAKYKIIMDSKALMTSANKPVVYLRRNFRFSQFDKIRFNGSSASSGETGRIWMAVASDSAALSHPTTTGYTRLVYKDL